MEKLHVEMTTEEVAEFNKFKKEKEKKELAERQRQDREAYRSLVDEQINSCFPILQEASDEIAATKTNVWQAFDKALELKGVLFGTEKLEQSSHTFTNEKGDKRIVLGTYTQDFYDDTADNGIKLIREVVKELGTDEKSKALVDVVLKLLSKDKTGNLKASRVLQLRQFANRINDERFDKGVELILESYKPVPSKQFIRAEYKDDMGKWCSVPLGMTEA